MNAQAAHFNKGGFPLRICDEHPQDEDAIAALITAAFAEAPHSSGTEATIVAALRRAQALTLSLVAKDGGDAVIGHIAFSPVAIAADGGGSIAEWYGLGPIAVAPDRQRNGVGAALIHEGLARLEAMGAHGCVLLGDPAYYRRFGFVADAALRYPGPPPEYFQALAFAGHSIPKGVVRYHASFG